MNSNVDQYRWYPLRCVQASGGGRLMTIGSARASTENGQPCSIGGDASEPHPGVVVLTQGLPLKRMVAIGLGNALEFYDFMISSFFAVQVGHAFFPTEFGARGLLYTLATFGVGFFMRPLGGIVIGRYGDARGRKPAMMWSFSLMGLSILGMALTPSYASIGIAAPILLLCFRLLQGFAVGGEVGPITAYAAEAAPRGHRARYVSILQTGQGLAVLCAGLIGYSLARLLTPGNLDAYGWGRAVVFGVVGVPIGLLIRR